ncbi:MAG: MBL fold metallo-hydrolase [Thermoleophilia bacterium]|nr:MBL fold metallo-hydrolase [Thermoleophilia bacterium]
MNTHFNVRRKVFRNRRGAGQDAANRDTRPAAPPPPQAPPDSIQTVLVDSLMHGEKEKMGACLVPGIRPALIDPGPANTADNVIGALGALGINRLDSIVLTHIHFDHAGGAGHLAERFPEATVYIHSRVARHLADPARLTESVRAVWGEQTEALFGLPMAVSEERIQRIDDGDTVDLGDRRLGVIATPGHTRGHLAYLDQETGSLFCGDALGVQLPGSQVIRPSTPPMDFCLDDAVKSIETIKSLKPESVYMSHFGQAAPGPEQACDQAIEAIRRWYESFLHKLEIAESDEDLRRRFHACLEATLEPVSPVTRRNLETVNPAWLNIEGMTGALERDTEHRAA